MQTTRLPLIAVGISTLMALEGCTQETQNKFGRAVQNWTGSNGVLEIYADEVKVYFEFSDYSTPYIFYAQPPGQALTNQRASRTRTLLG